MTCQTIMEVTIRNIDKQSWQEFKAEVIREGLNVGDAVNLAIHQWLSKEKKPSKSFFKSKPAVFRGKNPERLSEDIDEVLYS